MIGVVIGKWKRFWRAFGLAWRVLRLSRIDSEWSADDALVLRNFLQSGTGLRLDQKMIEEIVSESQQANAEGGPAFSQGKVQGKREIWVALRLLASAGVSPEDDTSNDYY